MHVEERRNYTKTAGNFWNSGEGGLIIINKKASFLGGSVETSQVLAFRKKVIWIVFLQPAAELGKFRVACGAWDFELRPWGQREVRILRKWDRDHLFPKSALHDERAQFLYKVIFQINSGAAPGSQLPPQTALLCLTLECSLTTLHLNICWLTVLNIPITSCPG